MLPARDPESHRSRLRELSTRFRAEERFMQRALINLQEEIDRWHEANDSDEQGHFDDLHSERNELNSELHHVRMAMLGANDELARTNKYQRLGA